MAARANTDFGINLVINMDLGIATLGQGNDFVGRIQASEEPH